MFRTTFGIESLRREILKIDFHNFKHLGIKNPLTLDTLLATASYSAHHAFEGASPLKVFSLKGKRVFKASGFTDEIVLRKLRYNLSRAFAEAPFSRDQIVEVLPHFLREGVPYRIYRLDVKSFYESFNSAEVIRAVNENSALSPLTKTLVTSVMNSFIGLGGEGVPRGLAISSSLSELMMRNFDEAVSEKSGVFFYARYVDDILVITHCKENKTEFIQWIESILPSGLVLNLKKTNSVDVDGQCQALAPPASRKLDLSFEYLGYSFSVFSPVIKGAPKGRHRDVVVDVARSKINKIKSRLAKSFLTYRSDGNFENLELRVRYLTSNFSLWDVKKERSKLAGIYFSYPLVSDDAMGLNELDSFLRGLVLEKNRRLMKSPGCALSSSEVRKLLKQSFSRGHRTKSFTYFHPRTMALAQEGWKYE